jgi:integrase/recombinase XerD
MTIQEQLDKYAEYLTARSLSLNYRNVIRIWLNYLQTKALDTFTQETITQFFTENQYKDNSKSQFIRAGRNYYGEYLQIPKEQSEWHKIKLMKVESKTPDCITEEELDKGISVMITHNGRLMNSTKLKAFLHFLFYSGVRKQEVLNLHRKDFDFTNNTAKVLGKFDKERLVYFPKVTGKEIQEFFTGEPEKNNAFNVSLGQLNYMPRVLGKILGKKCYMHLFRHSGARNMSDKGIELPVLQRILGHASIQTTMIYLKPDQKTVLSVYKKQMNPKKETQDDI